MSASKKDPSWLKPTVDYGPIIIFFVVYLLSSNGKDNQQLLSATAAIMIATVIALIISLIVAKRVPMVPLITAGIVGVFGGLTLWFKDDTFIKMKPTIVEALFSLILFGGLLFKKSLLKILLGSAWKMDDLGWHKLTLRFAFFFASMAILNEIVWRTQSTDFWVNFKVFGLMALTLVFAVTQAPLIQKHALSDKETPKTNNEND